MFPKISARSGRSEMHSIICKFWEQTNYFELKLDFKIYILEMIVRQNKSMNFKLLTRSVSLKNIILHLF